ncbi:uncharacterized protein OCT59_001408 [Rhizophagus irregularis]|uniref:uncharacterized protein n=1 Tax=Rhizophagus irregularis TaxID=588596 RepID=UPI003317F7AB|nr:hypothetical protein OCT59_001408 [Rhizophagus irregularis]
MKETPPGDSGDERTPPDERNAPWRLLEIKRTTFRDSWRQSFIGTPPGGKMDFWKELIRDPPVNHKI